MGNHPALVTMTCNNCGKKLAEIKIEKGVVSIKCKKCGTVNVIRDGKKT
jgi:phage FluMu protein Com